MKRLPLIIACLLIVVAWVILSPILLSIWLLGGDKPAYHITEAWHNILQWDDKDPN
jgi:hypothetical protein